MDGVIFDTIPFAREHFLKSHIGVTEEMYNEIHSGNFHIESAKYHHLKKPRTEEERIEQQNAYSEAKSKSRLFDGIEDLLKKLHKSGVTLILNTNAYSRNLMPLLENSKIKHLFNFIADAELSKSKTEKFGLIEKKFNLKKKDVLFVTDSLGDVREANIAEVPTVAVTWGVHNETYFNREPYNCLKGIVNSPEELRVFISNF